MHIEKGVTDQFDQYSVLLITELPKPWYIPRAWWVDKKIEIGLFFVLAADDETGLVTRQLSTTHGEPIFSNGKEDIIYSNTVKLLLLMPPFKEAFLRADYAPKTITTYEKGLKIINRNPTVSIAMSIQDAVPEEMESVKV